MAHKNIDIPTDGQPGQKLDPPLDEYDKAVTTQISSERLAKVFGDDVTDDPAKVRIVDTRLTANVKPADDDTLDIGFFLKDRFEIVELVHSSAMGHVYKAIDHRRHPEGSGGIHVAIKMMRSSIASQRETGLALEREAAKAQSLSHPNIINIFDFDQHDGHFFLVMEWLDGESVNALLRRTSGQRVAGAIAWNILRGAAAAVRHAHRNNIVHADINPSNIFVTVTGDVKLLDFGVARFIDDSVSSDDGQFAWTTRTYASPQILSGLAPVRADDVFSLGCVAYRLLCGKHPFDAAPSLVALQEGITVQRVEGLAEKDWQILQRALAYDVSERPDSVDLFLGGYDPHPLDANNAHAVTVRRLDPFDVMDLRELPRRWSSGTKQAGLIALVAAVLAGGWWLLQKSGGVGEPSPAESLAQRGASVASDGQSAADALVAVASQAIAAGEFVTSTGDDARTLFRYAVAMDPENAAALRGLRAISDIYVQRANEALRAGDVAGAYSAIEVATETDAGNPAIAITEQLLVAQGDSVLANARLAASSGVVASANEQLSRAEEYRHIDANEIQLIRQQIEQLDSDGQLLRGLALADAHISAGKLLPPGRDNAFAVLTDLQRSHGDDTRLLTSMEHLGERLLTRAAFATSAAQFDTAAEFLDNIDSLGVLSSEVEMARTALQVSKSTFDAAEKNETAPLLEEPSEETQANATPNEAAPGETAANVPGVETDQLDTESDALTASAARMASTAGILELAENTAPRTSAPGGSTAQDDAANTAPLSIGEVEFTNYVAPVFPRRALRRELTGYVDVAFNVGTDGETDTIDVLGASPDRVFVGSAVNAVEQWQFEPRDETARVSVRLRFDMPED